VKTLVFGAGVVGSFYAARLQEAGQDVSILARGQRLADIRKHGIVLENALSGRQTQTQVNTVEQLAADDAYDWVLVLMRKNQVPAVLPTLAENTHTPNVLFMMNNAVGPAEMIQTLRYDRVLLGFPGVGGVRDGHVVSYIAGRGGEKATVTLGEPDGRITPRLEQIRSMFHDAGISVRIEPYMDAWLKTHVALVSPMANALYMVGGDNYRLARTPDALLQVVRAIREGLLVLRTLGIPIRPPAMQALAWVPEPLLVAALGRLMDTRFAELGIAGHANVARDEMKHLAEEFQALVLSSGVPAPATECLYRYLDWTVPPIAPGSANLRMDWTGIWIGMGLLATLATLLHLRRLRRR
jgi:2-dehydropantoate 2-reductase